MVPVLRFSLPAYGKLLEEIGNPRSLVFSPAWFQEENTEALRLLENELESVMFIQGRFQLSRFESVEAELEGLLLAALKIRLRMLKSSDKKHYSPFRSVLVGIMIQELKMAIVSVSPEQIVIDK